MTTNDFLQIAFYVIALVVLSPLVGSYLHRVFTGERHVLSGALGWLERVLYRLGGVDPKFEMNWKSFTVALLLFNCLGIVAVFLIQLLQSWLPLNPQHLPATSWHLALNTAVSFVANTNWQSYAGETTMSYLTQMLALTVQNFLSAATGFAVLLALARGLSRQTTKTLGNFWVDLVRGTVYILLPLSIVLALAFVSEGVIQNVAPYQTVTTIEGQEQTIPLGPTASQEAIKQLGTNGGGYFNVNSAHPFENPTPFTNFLQVLALLILPGALCFAYGRMVGSQKHSWIIFLVMLTLLVSGLALSLYAEYSPNPSIDTQVQLEGKETRFGITSTIIYSTATTAVSCGAVNAMHSSLSPIAGGVALFNIMLGEIVFGGVGSGLYGMLLYVILTVFLAGLMVGRTPEYLGKKIEAGDIKMVMLAILVPNAIILILAGISAVLPLALSSLASSGPHGFSEILYAFSSATGNNGSAFAGLNANTTYWNVMLAIAMFVGRFAVIVPTLALAGNLVTKRTVPVGAGTFSTNSLIFAVLLLGVILIVGALTFLPALALGPIIEHFLMLAGRTF